MTLAERLGNMALRTAMIGLVAVGLLVGATTAHAATGLPTVGGHDAPDIDCNLLVGNGMLVHAPAILAAPVPYDPTIFNVGPSHVQWVAYRATLLKWNANTKTFAPTSIQGPWISWQAPDSFSTGADMSMVSFFQWTGSQWTPSGGATRFDDLTTGYYRVSIDYYWFPDAQVRQAGNDVIVPTDYTYTSTYTLIHTSYCQY